MTHALAPRSDGGTRRQLILGPPGTGKTTALLSHLERELQQRESDRVAFVSFTKAARREATERAMQFLDCAPGDLPWCRTIHSTAFRLMGLKGTDLMLAPDWKTFSEAYGYKFGATLAHGPDDDPVGYSIIEDDDALVAVMEWGRSRRLPLDVAIRRAPFRVTPDQVEKFVARYTAYKHEQHKLDFTDLLERSLQSADRPPVETAIIDEAQDLSPLQIALVEHWFGDCGQVFVAGDDDQAIYNFIGADPQWLLGLSAECPTQVLSQSYRVPALPHALAQSIIAQNQMRVRKQYAPRPADGQIVQLYREDVANEINEAEDTFVLGRNWFHVRSFAKVLRKSGIAFSVEKYPGLSPLGATKVVTAFRAVEKLARGREIPARHCDAVFQKIPSGKHGGGLLPRGSKKRAKENTLPVTLATLRSWGLDLLSDQIIRIGPEVLLRVPRDQRDALRAIMRRYGRLPNPKVILMSMHASKGREADTVVVLPDMSARTFRAYQGGEVAEREAENRVAYVAATRTRSRLVIVHPQGPRCYPYEDHLRRSRPKPAEERTEDDWWFG